MYYLIKIKRKQKKSLQNNLERKLVPFRLKQMRKIQKKRQINSACSYVDITEKRYDIAMFL